MLRNAVCAEVGSRSVGVEEESEERKSLKARLEGAMAQCLHVLYGVDLSHRDPDWGSMEVCYFCHAHMPCHSVLFD